MKKRVQRGVCRICGCTETKPCLLQLIWGGALIACSWNNAARTLCTNPKCIRKARRSA